MIKVSRFILIILLGILEKGFLCFELELKVRFTKSYLSKTGLLQSTRTLSAGFIHVVNERLYSHNYYNGIL